MEQKKSKTPGLSNVKSPVAVWPALASRLNPALGIVTSCSTWPLFCSVSVTFCPTATWMLLGLNLNSEAVIETLAGAIETVG